MKEELQLLSEAICEINSLRRQSELMKARLDMFDSVNAILNTDISRKGYGETRPDIAKQIEKFIASKG